MAALVEVHNRAELAAAERIGAGLLGINNRDLHTFVTSLAVTEELLRDYRGGALVVAESGIDSPADIRRLAAAGAQAFLIGESLLRDGRPRERLAAMAGACDERRTA
jgi:indole-3-glycerol phosphate synthase